jgi:site-specific recombinase XerD
LRLRQRKKTSLKVYRRHRANCPGKAQGLEYMKCSCPLWMQGVHDGQPIRQSLGTRSMQEALRQVALLEAPHATQLKPVREAVEAYQNHIQPLEPGSRRKYGNVLRRFLKHCEETRVEYIADVTVECLDDYRQSRTLAPSTAAKELEILRLLFAFSLERKWTADNPAKKIKPPRNERPPEVVPYKAHEVARIVAACDGIGKSRYERLRARALVLLMRYTGLRISDVATLAKDRVQDGQIFLHTKKTGGAVFLPIPKILEDALAALPAPRRAARNPRCYFWNEVSSRRVAVGTAERTLSAAFKLSGVPGARSHKFRHTLATEILARGGTEQDVADILGISAAVVRKHYAKWSRARQDRIAQIFRAVHPEAFGGETAAEFVQNLYTGKNNPLIN